MTELYPVHRLQTLRWLRLVAALLGGLCLSAAFAPLEWWWMAWPAFLPLLALPTPQNTWERLAIGFLFGYSHFATTLHWLNTVGFGAGWLLAAYCALYPTAWYCLYCKLLWLLKPREALSEEQSEETRKAALRPGAALWHLEKYPTALIVAALAACAWTALEWVRAWLFTGFPWNQIGISQAGTPIALIARHFGIYAISFLVLFSAGVLILAGKAILQKAHRTLPAIACLAWFALLAISLTAAKSSSASAPHLQTTTLRVLAIQGDVPECRVWDEQIFDFAWKRYADLTRQGLQANAANPPDLILWPEGPLPAPITYAPFASRLKRLLQEIRTPILLGALDIRLQPGKPPEEAQFFNTAFLLTAESPVLSSPYGARGEYYDKIHRVPFGEYVPFGKYFPWLAEAIGMGRDLTPGLNYKVFQIKGIKIGVNICFEDVFPEISRRFVQDGADLLLTITNDCWYLHSSGARQHLNHARLRAVETNRTLLRSGNNSDTCLITPNGGGKILDPIQGQDGSPFGPGWKIYELAPEDFRASTKIPGSGFPILCAVVTAALLFWLHWQTLRQHAKWAKVLETAKK